jgi:chorismate synthase
MAGNNFGEIFRITTFGESHGAAIGVVIDGCPSGVKIDETYIQKDVDRRKPGQSSITTSRQETDKIKILSGIFQGTSTGAPITIITLNHDVNPKDYENLKDLYRPSHADYTYQIKYGIRDYNGGGRSSARETLARVIAGSIAKIILNNDLDIEILSYVSDVHNIKANINPNQITIDDIESNIIRCPDQKIAKQMIEKINDIREKGDSVGGIISTIVKNMPKGLGEPVFDKLNADLAKAMFSINAVKGFEIGSGFSCINFTGKEHNDEFIFNNNTIKTKTNNSGGIMGGISNGENLFFKTAFKPVSTIRIPQQTINKYNETVNYTAEGRHDPCVLARAVPIIDAMTALVLVDHYLRNKIYNKNNLL